MTLSYETTNTTRQERKSEDTNSNWEIEKGLCKRAIVYLTDDVGISELLVTDGVTELYGEILNSIEKRGELWLSDGSCE
jgi:hypothetical protein